MLEMIAASFITLIVVGNIHKDLIYTAWTFNRQCQHRKHKAVDFRNRFPKEYYASIWNIDNALPDQEPPSNGP